MFHKPTFRKDDSGAVTAVLPNTSRTCFDGDAIACLIASKIAMAALTCTAAFLPTFLSYFGDFTESIMNVMRRAPEAESCRGSRRAKRARAASTTWVNGGGNSGQNDSVVRSRDWQIHSGSCSADWRIGMRNFRAPHQSTSSRHCTEGDPLTMSSKEASTESLFNLYFPNDGFSMWSAVGKAFSNTSTPVTPYA